MNSMLTQLLLFTAIANSAAKDDMLTEVYKDMGLIPNDLNKPPDGNINIIYDKTVFVENGNELTPTQTKNPPFIEWANAIRTYYTLIMVCPDAPDSRNPYLREWLHWLVVNVPGTDLEQGNTLCPHTPIWPLKEMGLLRYVFFVFQQTEYLFFDEPHLNLSNSQGHENFNSMKMAKKYGMGHPVASAVFTGQWDEYVPTVIQQFHIVY